MTQVLTARRRFASDYSADSSIPIIGRGGFKDIKKSCPPPFCKLTNHRTNLIFYLYIGEALNKTDFIIKKQLLR